MKSSLIAKISSVEKTDYLYTHTGEIYTFLNPVSYLDALDNKELFCQFDGIFADGFILVLAIKLIYRIKVFRKSFDMTSLAPEIFSYAEKNGKSVYIVASKQEEVEEAVRVFHKHYPFIKIIRYRNGYFRDNTEVEQEVRHIIKLQPDFLIVGMGIVLQEEFLLKVKSAGFRGIGFTCGGFIHQTSRHEINYYPQWINRMNLRFIYRMYKEPHTRKRYLKAGVVFPIRFICERIFG